MTKIADLPDDPKYTIKNVASQTGIRPVTLRAWERRHDVLSPHRGANRYRLYSERDVAILRWLKNRIDEGISISNAVSELRSMRGNNIWPDAISPAPAQPVSNSDAPASLYARKLYDALVNHNENLAGDLLRQAHALFRLLTVCCDVIVPAMREIGEAWYRGDIRVSTEHFASTYLRGKMFSLFQAYPSRRNAPSIIIGCAPHEHHELGSLMLAVLLRSEGYRVEYLGPDIPIQDLAEYAGYEQPHLVILSATLDEAAYELLGFQEMLRQKRHTPIFGYGGRAFDLHPELRQQVPGNYLGNSLELALENIQQLLKSRNH